MTLFSIELPYSKSISNRLLIVQALSGNLLEISGLSDSTDTSRLAAVLISNAERIDAGDGGTTFRFLLPFLCLRDGVHSLTGTTRMQQRPIAELVEALRQLGAQIEYEATTGFPPLKIHGGNLKGGTVAIDVSRSSQFATALLLIAPFLPLGLKLNLKGEIVSSSYIDMTLNLMSRIGVRFHHQGNSIEVPAQNISHASIEVERDWSAAAFWYLLVAVTRGKQVRMKGLVASGVQGDEVAAELFSHLGVVTSFEVSLTLISTSGFYLPKEEIEFDLKSTPDLAPALMAACFALKQPARFTGVAHLQFKESDRLQVLQAIFTSAGALVEVDENSFQLLQFPLEFSPVDVNPLDDHRIAMTFGILAAAGFHFRIAHPEVVSKSYPDFWSQLSALGFTIPFIESSSEVEN
jgi:3-phosphoshikimate 1-carboxyvinyltransferase